MLPSFRLIAATFLCGFAVVFAGLRIASSLNDIHEALPVMAANAAPTPVEASADPEMRRGKSAVPVMYDMRFVASATSPVPMLVNLTPPLDLAPALPPPVIEKVIREELPPPPDASTAKPEGKTESKTESAVAAIKPEAPIAGAPAEATTPAPTRPPAAETPAVAAIAPQSLPEPAVPTAIDVPLPEPAAVDLTPASAASTDAKTTAIEPAAAPEPEASTVEQSAAAPASGFDAHLGSQCRHADRNTCPRARSEGQAGVARQGQSRAHQTRPHRAADRHKQSLRRHAAVGFPPHGADRSPTAITAALDNPSA